MQIKNTSNHYGFITKFFHWSIFLLFVCQYIVALVMTNMDKTEFIWELSLPTLYEWHKSVGLTILALALGRVIWRKVTTLPDWAGTLTQRERHISHWMERALYAIMFLMPLSGYVMSMAAGNGFRYFGLFEVPDLIGSSNIVYGIALRVHIMTAIVGPLVILSHIGLVLKHQFINRDRLLNRMAPF